MARIVYCSYPTKITGGQKTIFRHVQTLRELGFDAVWRVQKNAVLQPYMDGFDWIERDGKVDPDDAVVCPDDAPSLLSRLAQRRGGRWVVFVQNHLVNALLDMPPEERDGIKLFLTGSDTAMRWIHTTFPGVHTAMVPFFVDERVFKPGPERRPAIAYAPRKRRKELPIIKLNFRHRYPQWRDLPWLALDGATEAQVAETFASSTLFLSLNRLESFGMTALEAMSSGCIAAGFPGIGGREYATPGTGFWAPDEDCEAAVEALAEGARLVDHGGPLLEARRAAAIEMARRWSYARFRDVLERYWSRLAPDARL
jgi:hypothetical protein